MIDFNLARLERARKARRNICWLLSFPKKRGETTKGKMIDRERCSSLSQWESSSAGSLELCSALSREVRVLQSSSKIHPANPQREIRINLLARAKLPARDDTCESITSTAHTPNRLNWHTAAENDAVADINRETYSAS
jgi:hypothetical protein